MSDRAEVRTEFAALLTAGLTGPNGPAQAVYRYRVGDFAGQTPVVVLGSAGSERKRMSFKGHHAAYWLDLFVFVLYNLKDPAGAVLWSEQQAEDQLDQIEQLIGLLLDGNQTGASWKAIDYDGRSQIDIVPEGGLPYLREFIPMRFATF